MSFRLKLIISVTLLIAIAFGMGGTFLIASSFHSTLDAETESAIESYKTILDTLYLIESLNERPDEESLVNTLAQLDNQGNSTWQALALRSDDGWIYSSGDSSVLSISLPRTQLGPCYYVSVSDKYGHGLFITSSITVEEDQFMLDARFDFSNLYEQRLAQQTQFRTIYLAIICLAILTSVVLSFILTGKLKKLTEAVRRISGGDLSTRSNITSHDEFGQISRDFDAMADKLQETIFRLENEMQRQESFMGAFAHELKTPMTSIIGYADLLRQGGLDDATRITAANYIFSEGQRLEKLSFKLLELLLMKNDALSFREVSLSGFLSEIETALAPELEEKGIHFTCSGSRGYIKIEPDLVKSLLYNLVDNAAKAIDNGGNITLKGTIIPNGCQFIVQDNGRGMEQPELAKITEAFYRVDKSRSRKQGGAGLGLALCKEIVALHHGSMRFESKVDTGTTVTVTLYGEGQK